MSELNTISGRIVDAAFRIHSTVGPGLFESVYEAILARDLARGGLRVEQQKEVAFDFEGLRFEKAFRVDLLVEDAVVVEIKSVSEIAAVHRKQLLTYLRLLDCRLGLILNFGAPYLKDGITRVVNKL